MAAGENRTQPSWMKILAVAITVPAMAILLAMGLRGYASIEPSEPTLMQLVYVDGSTVALAVSGWKSDCNLISFWLIQPDGSKVDVLSVRADQLESFYPLALDQP